LEESQGLSIGVWIVGEAEPVLAAPEAQQPVSYASWLFNEWVWQRAMKKSASGD
jgi:hypothetical protein